MNQLVTLPPYTALRLVEILKSEGIPSETTDGTLTAYEMGGGTSILSVWVLRKEDLEQAREIMQEMLEENERKVKESWTCPECGESSPAISEVCWNCCADSEDFADDEITVVDPGGPSAPIEEEFYLSAKKGSWVWNFVLVLSAIGCLAILIQGIALLMKP